MRPRHVLILNQYFPPDTSATAAMIALVADALAQRHHVTMLSGRPSYDPAIRHPFYLLRRERRERLLIERVGSTTYPRHRMRQRLSNYLSYLALAVPRALTIKTDVIVAMTDPPVNGIAGALVAKLRRCPCVYNIRDLHPDMILASEIVRPNPWVERWERAHRWALRQADLVIVLGEDMRERVVAKGVRPERVKVIRDGVPLPKSMPSPTHPVSQEVRCGFPFVVLHAGNIGFYGAWQTLVQAARLLENEDVGFIFVGDGAARPSVEALVNGCRTVRFLPFRPVNQVPHVLVAGDLHVVTIRRGLEGLVVPSKLYPILAAGRPVLAVAPESSDVARIVRQTDCGMVANPDDPHSVVAAVRQLIGAPECLLAMGRRAREAASEYERDKHLQLFVHAVEQVTA
jgi:colanic acid biosynthesis glycosyl transferase WcaI